MGIQYGLIPDAVGQYSKECSKGNRRYSGSNPFLLSRKISKKASNITNLKKLISDTYSKYRAFDIRRNDCYSICKHFRSNQNMLNEFMNYFKDLEGLEKSALIMALNDVGRREVVRVMNSNTESLDGLVNFYRKWR